MIQARITGPLLKIVARAVTQPPAKFALAAVLRRQLGINEIFELHEDIVAPLPMSYVPQRARLPRTWGRAENVALPKSPLVTLEDMTRRFAQGLSPITVVERALTAIGELDQRTPSMNPFLVLTEERALREAAESQARYRSGMPLGPFDGVPIAVKEEICLQGLPCLLGSQTMPSEPKQHDAVCIQRLRAQGAVILGHTVMTEYGMSTLGANQFRGMPRNVHDSSRLAGGSSTGSAVAVALGMLPLAVGSDGGGSLRVPAAFNGIFALKPTFGRVPLTGHGAVAGSSVVHVGPLASTTRDLAEFLEVTHGRDEGDPASMDQPEGPAGSFRSAVERDAHGLRVAMDEDMWKWADERVAGAARSALVQLEKQGVELVPIRTRLLKHAAAIGYLTIGGEVLAALRDVKLHRSHLGRDLQVMLAGLETLGPDDYVIAQRLRGALRRELAEIFRQVDLLAFPTVGSIAPKVTDWEMQSGFVDPEALNEGCRYSFLANLAGIPAGTAPVGQVEGMPVGLQLLGDAYDEATVLAGMAALERAGLTTVQRPRGSVDLLGPE